MIIAKVHIERALFYVRLIQLYMRSLILVTCIELIKVLGFISLCGAKRTMKKYYFILLYFYCLTGYSNQKLSHKETVSRNYNACNSGIAHEIKATINDSIRMMTGDYATPQNRENNGIF